MMVQCAGWEDGIRQARATPTLGIGLHFNLLVGRPLSAAASLRNARGEFLSLGALVRSSLRGAIHGEDVVAECEAQLAALQAAGIRVTHIDSHRHTHALPVIRRAVAQVAAVRGLPLRRPVESHRRFPNDIPSQLHRALIAWSWRATSFGAPPTRAPDHFIGVSMQGGDRFAERFMKVIDTLPAGTTEMMVHPGYVDAALTSADGYTWQREREREALTAPALREQLRRREISLIGFAAL